MCGIAGIVALRDHAEAPSRAQLIDMAGALRHRGPDEFGLYRDDRAGLAHARLSIIDLSTRPAAAGQRGRRAVGRLQRRDLQLRRAARGARSRSATVFRTRSDTEVIVHAYEAWGDEAFRRFNGQWAIALWDRLDRTLVLARDPFGVRPLYLCEHAGRLYFASEVKAIFAADPSIPTRVRSGRHRTDVHVLDAGAAADGVRGGDRARAGRRAGLCRRPRQPRARLGPFVSGVLGGRVPGIARRCRRRRAGGARATRPRLRMLRADVPVGSYLSGGLDSSLVAALGLRAKGAQFNTFSLRFEDAEYDETEFQRLMVERLGSDHHEVVVSRARHRARCSPTSSRTPSGRSCGRRRRRCSCCRSWCATPASRSCSPGEGADEMFAGYDLFREAKVRRFWAREPQSAWRPRLLERLYPYLAALAGVAARPRAPVLRPGSRRRRRAPGFGHDLRWRSTSALQPPPRPRVA